MPDREDEEHGGEDLSQVPRPNRAGQIATAVAKAAVSIVPFAGGPAAELLDQVVGPVLQRRREEWFEQVGAKLEELEQREQGFNVADLAKDEAAMTVLLTATSTALRTHEEAKLAALRNAVLNTALRLEPDDHVRLLFLGYVNDLTALHLRLLAYLRNPSQWYARAGIPRPAIMGARAQLVEGAFPELRGQREIYLNAAADLSARSLINGGLTGMVSASGMWDTLTTPLGNRFLDFISDPAAGPDA